MDKNIYKIDGMKFCEIHNVSHMNELRDKRCFKSLIRFFKKQTL